MIIKYPNKILRQECEPVLDMEQARVVAGHLIEQMYANNGKGLAAPQIGHLLRMFVVDIDSQSIVMINPYIQVAGKEVVGKEGCLSFPGKVANIKRYEICSVAWTDTGGNQQTRAFANYDARCILHEADHLKGILITDKMGPLSRRIFLKI